jgi:AcrR family transcriptional regulator
LFFVIPMAFPVPPGLVTAGRNRIIEAFVRSIEKGFSVESNRRDTLLKIGERLFAQHGYRDVSIRDITSSVGLGMGSFYTYFPSKEDFYSHILDGIEQRGMKEVEKRVNAFHSPLFRLKALFRYITLSLQSNEILRGIYTGEKRYLYPGLEERNVRGNTLFARIETLIEEILEEGTRKGVFRTSLFRNPRRMLVAIFTTLPFDTRGASTEDLIDDVMMLIERGLKRWLRFRRDERLDTRARRRR